MITQGTGLIVICLLVLSAILFGIHRFLQANPNSVLHQSKGWLYAFVTFLGLLIIFALLPIDTSAKSSVFSLVGLVVTAVIAISSTTFASNIMAGIMLRMIRNFQLGDFIEVGEHFGRVSEVGLLHTEIQTKSHTLTTLPNLYLVTNAVTVVPQNKALIDATLSLGYDVSHHQVEKILKSAAEKIGLFDAFVQVIELGDFSISYRVAGFLDNPKLLLSMRSNLRKQVIDSLHSADIEIVSPTFMNQRQYRTDEVFISEVKNYQERQNSKTEKTHVFDKAETAETLAELKIKLKTLEEQLKVVDEQEKEILSKEKQQLNEKIESLSVLVDDENQTDDTEIIS